MSLTKCGTEWRVPLGPIPESERPNRLAHCIEKSRNREGPALCGRVVDPDRTASGRGTMHCQACEAVRRGMR